MNIQTRLLAVQQALKAPKNEQGRFGLSRSAEGILEAAKPICQEHKLIITLSDELVQVGERNYVKATAAVIDEEGQRIEASAYAWEGEVSRGLDTSQLTGIASSYARKYALGGLFVLDDTKDADSKEHGPTVTRKPAQKPTDKTVNPNHFVSEAQIKLLYARARDAWGITDKVELLDEFISRFGKAMNEVEKSEVDRILKKIGGDE